MSSTVTPVVTIKELLDAGVHLGHKSARRNPKMDPYIFATRNDISIINLQYTVGLISIAYQEIYNTVRKNGRVLFVATKPQARDVIAESTEKCGQYYVNHRWLGGTLTNWVTVSKRIKTLEQLEKILEDDSETQKYTKKEILSLRRSRNNLYRSLGGIKNMGGKPDLILIIDTNKEHLALKEAKKLNIPVIAILDSNSDPTKITYPVPGNDDAIKSIKLYCDIFAEAALKGIEDALVASGVDIGALSGDNTTEKFKAAQKITRIKSNKKVTKSASMNITDKQDQEFTDALEQLHTKKD